MAINVQGLEGQWNQLKSDVKERWGQLSDDDLKWSGGNIDQLVGRIQQRTGESREAIEKYLDQLTAQGSSVVSNAVETVGSYANKVSHRLRDGYDQISEQAHERYQATQDSVRQNPTQSVAAAAGVGLAAGLLIGSSPRTATKVVIGAAAGAAVGVALKDMAIMTSLGAALEKVVAKVRSDWGLNRKEFGRLIGYSERVIADWERGKTISEPALRRVIEVARLHRGLVDALAGVVQPGVLPRWLTTPNKAFDDSTPLQVIERGEVDRVWNMVYELGSGMPS